MYAMMMKKAHITNATMDMKSTWVWYFSENLRKTLPASNQARLPPGPASSSHKDMSNKSVSLSE